mmetsp:Transcript_46376/g.138639  ORF Transcript_46376/g.138639 Transcript_46376/m.138639 type:complete len:309 (-) Transcript_46376:6-932(-)
MAGVLLPNVRLLRPPQPSFPPCSPQKLARRGPRARGLDRIRLRRYGVAANRLLARVRPLLGLLWSLRRAGHLRKPRCLRSHALRGRRLRDRRVLHCRCLLVVSFNLTGRLLTVLSLLVLRGSVIACSERSHVGCRSARQLQRGARLQASKRQHLVPLRAAFHQTLWQMSPPQASLQIAGRALAVGQLLRLQDVPWHGRNKGAINNQHPAIPFHNGPPAILGGRDHAFWNFLRNCCWWLLRWTSQRDPPLRRPGGNGHGRQRRLCDRPATATAAAAPMLHFMPLPDAVAGSLHHRRPGIWLRGPAAHHF